MPVKTVWSVDGFEVPEDYINRNDNITIDEQTLDKLSCIVIQRRMYCYIKRMVDIVLSLTALAVLMIPFAIVSLAIYLDDPGPIIFRQYRVGRYGKRFRIYKFRSMMVETPKYMPTVDVKDSSIYTTRVGRIIRKLSIDELPQLVNVLLGDMSLVGPRPLISDEYEIHKMRMRLGVYAVRPGITGLAQINGRDAVSAEDKVRYDVKYLESFGFFADLKIILMTIPRILSAHGVAEK